MKYNLWKKLLGIPDDQAPNVMFSNLYEHSKYGDTSLMLNVDVLKDKEYK